MRVQLKQILLITLLFPLLAFAQTFELKNGNSMCMVGKGAGQDATINPYGKQDSYATIENLGSIEFGIRIEKEKRVIRELLVKPKAVFKIQLPKSSVLYLDSFDRKTARASILYSKD